MIRYDSTNIFDTADGLKWSEFRAMSPALQRAKRAVIRMCQSGDQGFLNLPYEKKHVNQCRQILSKIPKSVSDVIVLGIGGSDLGGRMLLESLGTKKGFHVHFGGSTTDPDEVYRLLHSVDFKKTCVNIVSKSGGTIEPMASFLLAREMLIKACGKKRGLSRIIATTDSTNGSLHELAKTEGYLTLEIPSNVGGRFSVLSSVGLFPLIADGGDAEKLLSGAREMAKKFKSSQTNDCLVSRYAGIHAIATRAGKGTHVLMPYIGKLRSFGLWYRQLVAESLGKKTNRAGRETFSGITPVSALGPEDQHSQLQLYIEGPKDKLMTFIEADGFDHPLETPQLPQAQDPIRGYGNIRFADMIHAERSATAESLRREGRPNETIFIKKCDASSVGALIIFFEVAIAMMGELSDVDAFDQPGVELSKTLMKKMFKAP